MIRLSVLLVLFSAILICGRTVFSLEEFSVLSAPFTGVPFQRQTGCFLSRQVQLFIAVQFCGLGQTVCRLKHLTPFSCLLHVIDTYMNSGEE